MKKKNEIMITRKRVSTIETSKTEQKLAIATFGAGCFWGVEQVFSQTPGVVATRVGYAGGSASYKNPSYEQVCSGKTGHAEVVEVTFDPHQISYPKLLDIFWKSHDPTQFNRQGPDIGAQYRSIIFYHSEEQQKDALTSRDAHQKKLGAQKKIMTEIVPASPFYPAEEYHQKYFEKHGGGVCHH